MNIVLIAVDSLRRDRMSCYGYHRLTTPHIDKFAQEALLFEDTISTHIPTTSAYASMLTGRDCFGTGVVALRHRGPMRDGVRTLPEILREHGYDTTCVGFSRNPASRGFDRYLDYTAWGTIDDAPLRKAELLNEVALPELDRLQRQDRPFLLFLRHMDPHSPYLPPEPFASMFYAGDACDPSKTSMRAPLSFEPFAEYFRSWMPEGITDAGWVLAQYDGALAYMDACIRSILERVQDEDTIVVVNGDHGETLDEHDCYFDHHGLYEPTLVVPLIIRAPGLAPGRRAGHKQHKDLLPTLLELTGLPPEPGVDGRSLTEHVDEPEMYITECTWMRKHGWRTPEWKLILALEPDFHGKPPVELYDLVRDPLENENVADRNPEVVQDLTRRLETHIASRGVPNPILDPGDWHGIKGLGPFTSSRQAYDSLRIRDPRTAQRLQANA